METISLLGQNANTILMIVTLVAMVVAVLVLLFPYLKKKGVDVGGALTATTVGIDAADLVVDALQGVFPNSPALLIVDKIIEWARKGTEAAEQLYHINSITGDQRKDEATKFVYDALKVAEIEITPAVEKIVDGCIEAAVFTLGHTATSGDGIEEMVYESHYINSPPRIL